ncbi:MAG: hypothetical protein ACTHQE_17910 [Thermomicrobiales bacterium]
MPSYGEIPYGLEDAKVAPITGVSTVGTLVDIPGVRSIAFNVEADSDELEGDNQVISKVRKAPSLSGSVELGKINFAAIAVFRGVTATVSGSTPNQINSMSEPDTSSNAWFQLTGQAPDTESVGSAYRVTLNKLISTSGPDETMEVNSWNTPTIDFEGVGIGGFLLKRQQYETKTAIAA